MERKTKIHAEDGKLELNIMHSRLEEVISSRLPS